MANILQSKKQMFQDKKINYHYTTMAAFTVFCDVTGQHRIAQTKLKRSA